MVYHGYENGYWTLGRQALLEPIEWTDDGWLRPLGGDLSQPIAKPLELGAQPHGHPLSDDFSTDRFGTQWSLLRSAAPARARGCAAPAASCTCRGKGTSPSDCSPLTCIAGDQAYRFEADIEVDPGAEAGLLLFYNRRLYAGLGFGDQGLVMHRYGLQRPRGAPPGQRDAGGGPVRAMRLRLTNDRNILTIHTSADGGASWQKFDVQMEVSGYHHNVRLRLPEPAARRSTPRGRARRASPISPIGRCHEDRPPRPCSAPRWRPAWRSAPRRRRRRRRRRRAARRPDPSRPRPSTCGRTARPGRPPTLPVETVNERSTDPRSTTARCSASAGRAWRCSGPSGPTAPRC